MDHAVLVVVVAVAARLEMILRAQGKGYLLADDLNLEEWTGEVVVACDVCKDAVYPSIKIRLVHLHAMMRTLHT